ncbi:hypothetical protein GQR58_027765 [Nymphon striatum]|nr:hypothetical protein GQR58_027765 [Nymphon striatum]
MDKNTINNQVTLKAIYEIVSMRPVVKKSKCHTINKLVRTIRGLKKKKGSEEKTKKFAAKADRLAALLPIIKKIPADDIFKFALTNNVFGTTMANEENHHGALTKLTKDKSLQTAVEKFKEKNKEHISRLPHLFALWSMQKRHHADKAIKTSENIREQPADSDSNIPIRNKEGNKFSKKEVEQNLIDNSQNNSEVGKNESISDDNSSTTSEEGSLINDANVGNADDVKSADKSIFNSDSDENVENVDDVKSADKPIHNADSDENISIDFSTSTDCDPMNSDTDINTEEENESTDTDVPIPRVGNSPESNKVTEFKMSNSLNPDAEIRKINLDDLSDEEVPIHAADKSHESKQLTKLESKKIKKSSFFIYSDNSCSSEEDNIKSEDEEKSENIEIEEQPERSRLNQSFFRGRRDNFSDRGRGRNQQHKEREHSMDGKIQIRGRGRGRGRGLRFSGRGRSFNQSRGGKRPYDGSDANFTQPGDTPQFPVDNPVKKVYHEKARDIEVLHPSWAAKKKQKERETGIPVFQGKKIRFD